MSKTPHATALGLCALLSLAGCGGPPDSAPAPNEQRAQGFGAPTPSAPPAAGTPAPANVATNAAVPGDDPASMKQQVALLQRAVAEIRQQLARMPGAAAGAEPAPDPRTDPAARIEAERVEQQRIASTETAFRNEKEDARWSQTTAAALRAALGDAAEALRNRVGSIECRSQSCRVVIGGDTRGSAGQDLTLVMMRLAETLPNVTAGQIDQGDGRPATVLYLSR